MTRFVGELALPNREPFVPKHRVFGANLQCCRRNTALSSPFSKYVLRWMKDKGGEGEVSFLSRLSYQGSSYLSLTLVSLFIGNSRCSCGWSGSRAHAFVRHASATTIGISSASIILRMISCITRGSVSGRSLPVLLHSARTDSTVSPFGSVTGWIRTAVCK